MGISCFVLVSDFVLGIRISREMPVPASPRSFMESQFLAWLRSRLPAHRQLEIGPGDDAAMLRLVAPGQPSSAGADCLVSVDVLSDGVDFHLDGIDPRRAGRKCLA